MTVELLSALKHALATAKVSRRGRTTTYRFGTADIRDLAGGSRGVECVRVYESPPHRRACGHKHCDAQTAAKCARAMAAGEWSESTGASWVEIVPWVKP